MTHPSVEAVREKLSQVAKSELSRKILTEERAGASFNISISPCSWMYPNYGLQITVEMVGGGTVTVLDKSLPFDRATEADMLRLFNTVGTQPCSCQDCTRLAFDPTTVSTNREGQCETCFIQALDAIWSQSMEKDRQEIAALDAQYYEEGMTHRIDAWIHPSTGDDRQICLWMAQPTDSMIRKVLKKKGCHSMSDYTVTKLEPPEPSPAARKPKFK